MVPDPDICHTRPILRKGITCQGRKLILDHPREDRASDRQASDHTGHVVLGYHAEYLAGPCFQCLSLDSGVIGSNSLCGDIAGRRVFTGHMIVDLADSLPPGLHGIIGYGGLRHLPASLPVPWMDHSYQ